MMKNNQLLVFSVLLLIIIAFLFIPASAKQINSSGSTNNSTNSEINVTCKSCSEINSVASFPSQSENNSSESELLEIKESISKKGKKWHAENNSISKMPKEEFIKMLGAKKELTAISGSIQSQNETISGSYTTVPGTLDWRSTNGGDWTTPIRNQANCGSCWAFGTLGAVESRVKIIIGDPSLSPDYSEQELVSCAVTNGCNGAYMNSPFNYMLKTGVVNESIFRYTSGSGSVPACPGIINSPHQKITSWTTLSGKDNIKNALLKGPITATFDVYNDFRYYSGGVYEHSSGSYQGGHAVTMVGWGEDSNGTYWICKNSWGTGWGESGWFKIRSGDVAINDYLMEATPDLSSTSVAPTVTSITPASGITGTTVSVTNLAGTNFRSRATVKLQMIGQSDITASSVVISSSKKITCKFTIPSTVAAGNWDVVVTNSDGTTGMKAAGFSITTQPAPTVTSITPASGKRGTSLSITNLAGTNFRSGVTVKLQKIGQSDIIASNIVRYQSSKITCKFTIPSNAATGNWNMVVTNSDGTSGMKAFNIM
jgi:C1A family cysteine protease